MGDKIMNTRKKKKILKRFYGENWKITNEFYRDIIREHRYLKILYHYYIYMHHVLFKYDTLPDKFKFGSINICKKKQYYKSSVFISKEENK